MHEFSVVCCDYQNTCTKLQLQLVGEREGRKSQTKIQKRKNKGVIGSFFVTYISFSFVGFV